MDITVFFFVYYGVKIYQFEIKDSEIYAYPLFWGNTSKDFTVDNIKKLDHIDMCMIIVVLVDYSSIDVDNILNIHKYLMKKWVIKCFDLLKKCLLDYYVLMYHML